MTRLLIACEFASRNGGENSMLSVLPRLIAAGFEPQVAAPSEGPLAEALRRLGVEVISWPTADADLSARRNSLAAIIRRTLPRLVHANSLSTTRISGPVVAESAAIGVGHLRDILRISRRAMKDVNRCDGVLCVSEATRSWHLAQGLDASRSRVLYNGVDLETFRPRAASGYLHQELSLPDETRLIAAVGQIGMRKGLDVLLNAAETVFERMPDVVLLLAGERHSQKEEAVEYERRLHNVAASGSLAGRVRFLGRRSDTPRLLNELTLLVHAARQEPLGRVLLEGAASGLPIVATNVGGTAEIFPPNKNAAVLCPADDPAALAERILTLLGDEKTRKEKAVLARHRAETAFSAQTAAENLLAHYRELAQL